MKVIWCWIGYVLKIHFDHQIASRAACTLQLPLLPSTLLLLDFFIPYTISLSLFLALYSCTHFLSKMHKTKASLRVSEREPSFILPHYKEFQLLTIDCVCLHSHPRWASYFFHLFSYCNLEMRSPILLFCSWLLVGQTVKLYMPTEKERRKKKSDHLIPLYSSPDESTGAKMVITWLLINYPPA